ncbi:MAG: type 4a pilus biogenesis protein PilO [bacterium]|nr:type 4a pilus biogenesis protein PilO [bacterium]
MKHNILAKISKREKIIGAVAALTVVVFAAKTYVMGPLADKMSDFDLRILTAEKKLHKAYQILFRENTITREYEEKIKFVKQNRNEEEEIAVFLSEIENIASSSNVFLSDIKPGNVEKVKNGKAYSAEIRIESEISYIVDFVYQIERLPQMIRIKSFNFALKDKGSNELKGSLIVTLLLLD